MIGKPVFLLLFNQLLPVLGILHYLDLELSILSPKAIESQNIIEIAFEFKPLDKLQTQTSDNRRILSLDFDFPKQLETENEILLASEAFLPTTNLRLCIHIKGETKYSCLPNRVTYLDITQNQTLVLFVCRIKFLRFTALNLFTSSTETLDAVNI